MLERAKSPVHSILPYPPAEPDFVSRQDARADISDLMFSGCKIGEDEIRS